MTFNTHHITPNNDSINDELRIDIDVVNVLTPRALNLEIRDLTVKMIYKFSDEITAGKIHLFWNGRDMFQNKVQPGLYFAKISIDTDSPIQSKNRIISVIY